MKRSLPVVALIALVGFATGTLATEPNNEKTVEFTVEKMTCATCPISVRKAMERVDGVKKVEVDYESKTAVVTFDANIATAADIGNASTDVGFPATVTDTQ